ncbi:membrane cofactor protein-like [Ciona intestinalis]
MSSLIWIAIVGVIYIHFASTQVLSFHDNFRMEVSDVDIWEGHACLAITIATLDTNYEEAFMTCALTEVCTPIFPPRPSNGGFRCRSSHYQAAGTCMAGTYFCDHGYKLRGINYNVCFNHQEWQFESPSCVIDGCDPPTYREQQRISNGTYMPVQEHYNESSVITITCNTGYKPRNRNSYCTEYQSHYYWSPSVACDREVKCNPPALAYGNYSPRESNYSLNSTITVTCSPGYMLRGTPQSYCRGDRFLTYWSPSPNCTRILCNSPPRPFNGYRTPSWGYSWRVNSTVTYECRSGFKLIGENSSYCQECEDTSRCEGGGQWSNVAPTCISKGVCDPPSVRNGNYSPHRSEYNRSSVITITCNAGYTPRNQRSTCGTTPTYDDYRYDYGYDYGSDPTYSYHSWSPQPYCDRAGEYFLQRCFACVNGY